jgi:hypothetical protein
MHRRCGQVSLVVLGCAVSAATLSQPSAGFIYGRAAVGAGLGAIDVAAGDLDEDGRTDAVVTNWQEDTFSVLIGRDGGPPRAHGTYATGHVPGAVAIGHLDDDGHLDVAVLDTNCDLGICGPGSISVYFGDGGGAFSAGPSYATNTNPQELTIADLNGDGHSDIAVTNAITTTSQGPGTAQIFLGHGDGSFDAGVEYPGGDGVGGIVAGDFDEDGNTDLAIANGVAIAVTHAVAILIGNGDGSFGPPQLHDTALVPTLLVVGDLDRDGHLDLAAVALAGNVVSVLLGNGDGTFAPAVDYPAGFGPKSIAIGDLDTDGDLDLAVTTFGAVSRAGSIVILLGTGDGTFGLPDEYSTGVISPSLVAADFSGDGVPDLASTDLDEHVLIFRSRGDGTLERASSAPAGSIPFGVATADFDGDQALDIATANSQGDDLSVLLGHGDGTFERPARYDTGRSPLAIVAADFDGDGRPDLATADFDSGTASVLLGNGDGTFAAAVRYHSGFAPAALVAGDFNADGASDLAVANSGSGKVAILLGAGDVTFGAAIANEAGPSAHSLAAGDFDQDGILDLAVAAGQRGSFGPGIVDVLFGIGDGTFERPVRHFAGIDATSIVATDLDGDQVLDLVVGTNLDLFGFIIVLQGTPGGGFRHAGFYEAGTLTIALIAADVNGDSRPDIVAANIFNNTLTVLAGRGDGTFVHQANQDPGPIPAGLAAGDFDGDGLQDLAVSNQLTNAVGVLLSAASPPP